MKRTTKQFLGIAAASALAIGLANGVFAHGYGPGSGPGWGGHHGMMGGNSGMMGGYSGMQGPYGGPGWMHGGYPAAYNQQDLDQLKTTLGITDKQESAWNVYVDAVKGKAELQNAHREAWAGSDVVTPEQRLGFRQEGLAQRQKLVSATQDLYAVLTPAQKASATDLLGPRCATW